MTTATDTQHVSLLPDHSSNPLAAHHYGKIEELHEELEQTTSALGAFYANFDDLTDYSRDAGQKILLLIIHEMESITDDIHRHIQGLPPIRGYAPHALRAPEDLEKFWIKKMSNLANGGE